MQIDDPLVSFLLCIYNGEDYIEETLLSIISQSYKNYEVVIVNDASTDNSISIINKYTKFFNQYQIINNELNLGLTVSLNLAAKKARGTWLARIDSDDICHKDRILCQLALSNSAPSIAVVGSSCDFIDSNSKYLYTKAYDNRPENILSALQKVSAFFPHSSALIKKTVLFEVGGYNNFFKFAQDYDLWLRISEKYSLITSPKSLVSIRLHDKRVSNQSSGRSQIIYARVAIISYWLRNLHHIKLNTKNYETLYKKVTDYIYTHSYYIGYFSYLKCKTLFKGGRYLKFFFSLLRDFYKISFFVFHAIFEREKFLKSQSHLFIRGLK